MISKKLLKNRLLQRTCQYCEHTSVVSQNEEQDECDYILICCLGDGKQVSWKHVCEEWEEGEDGGYEERYIGDEYRYRQRR